MADERGIETTQWEVLTGSIVPKGTHASKHYGLRVKGTFLRNVCIVLQTQKSRLFGGLHIWFEAAEAFKRETGYQITVWNPGLQFAKPSVSMPARSASHLTPKRAVQSLRCVRCALAGSPGTAENSQKGHPIIADTQESN
ncbi:hypothetical protein GX48_01049 [Paracoccidioides brasiliensis]|nr:hypothetical protein GX48_01049 [Paracoccidioides brasiliensis]